MGVLCARECTAVASAETRADAAEHCHEPATPGTSINASTSDGCERSLAVAPVAMRDRTAPSVGDSLAMLPPVQLEPQPPSLNAFASLQRQLGTTHGFPPDTRVPLRI